MSEEELVEQLTKSMNGVAKEFIKSQIKLSSKKPKGRRHSINDKVLGLLFHKQSPRGYRLFSKIFSTPSRKTLSTFLQRILIDCGINDVIFNNLNKIVPHLEEREKLCCLMFDEMSIQPHLQFEPHVNRIYGFENLGIKSNASLADHAQVFMIKGIVKNWKQPVCFTFSKKTIKSMDLVLMIKSIILKCQEAGLKVLCTISDKGTTNVAAINHLKKIATEESIKSGVDPDDRYYVINNGKILHIYDPPHLLKGIRNNLLTRNLVWDRGNEKIEAKWNDIVMAHNIDNMPGELKIMPKITNAHVDSQKMKKMKVSVAVLSYSVASAIGLFARSGTTSADGQLLQPRAKDTANVLKFFDQLFDSVNGHLLYNRGGKILRCAVSASSPHVNFWREARQTLRTMYFQKEGTTEKVIPPSLKNWISTLIAFEEILKSLNQEGVSFFIPRGLNQDPVENFFGQVRQHGMRNTNPTPKNFQQSFRTLLVNNLASVHSISANCQRDDSDVLLNNVKEFIVQASVANVEKCSLSCLDNLILLPANIEHSTSIDKMAIGYVGGFIAKNINELSFCNDCKFNILFRYRCRVAYMD